MPNSNYVNGRAFEYRVKSDLEKRGYYVKRSYASKTVVDLLAYKHPDGLFVQCKRGTAKMSIPEWNELYTAALEYGGKPILAESPDKGIDYIELTGTIANNSDRERNSHKFMFG